MGFLRLTPVIIIGLRTFFYQVLFLLGTLFIPDLLHAELNAITPDRTITVVADQPDVPEWKTLWDKARGNVRENRYPAALKLYEELLKEKPNIEEANWEFCKVLLKMEDFSSAATVIATLVEKNPLRKEYLLAAGTVNLQQKNYPLAIKYFGMVYELDPGGSDSTSALTGLIDSLKGIGNDEAALPLLEQLHVREPDNVKRLHELARAAKSLNKLKLAERYYAKLLKMGPVDDRILFQASELFEDTNNIEMVVPLWDEYVRRNQNYLPFRQKLIDFYLANNVGMAALPHLLFIDNKVSDNDQLKLQIAAIYLHDARRPDKALGYYEKYLLKNPDDQTVKSNIADIQSILANDFLSIVENDGAWLLWRDLMEVTPNRLGIYLEMATLLEKKGKLKELLEILLIISDNKPHNDKVNYKIVDLYRQKKEYDRALDYLGKITASHNSTKKHFLLKGNIEELAGYEKKALTSYAKGLKVDKNDLSLRKQCVAKAGALGMVVEFEKFFNNSPVSHYTRKHIHFILNYFDQLAYNSLFSRLEGVYEYFLKVFKNDSKTLFDLQFHRVETLRQEGKTRKSEELLRKLSNVEQTAVEALFRLALNAVDDRDMQAFRSWYAAFENKVETSPPSQKNILKNKKALLTAKKFMASDDLPGAAYLITDLRKNLPQVSSKAFLDESESYQLEKELCWQYLNKRDFRKCEGILKRLQKNKLFDPDIVAIHTVMRREWKGTTDTLPSQYDLISGENPIISRLLHVAQVEIKHKEYSSAGKHLTSIPKAERNSLVARQLWAELSFKKGELKKAIDLYRALYDQYSDEGYFLKKIVVSESKRGGFRNAIAALLKNNGRLDNIDIAADYYDLSQDFEEVLFFARMLWGNKQQKKSLKVYELLLKPSVIDLLEKKFELKEIYYHYLTKDKSIWKSLRSLTRTKPEILAELMAPQFLIENLGNELGKIIADYYELYSWQKLILSEYLARDAIVQRNFAIAERNYKRLLEEEEENVEGLADLASIYDRFGQYRKEAKVYEVMRDAGVASTELDDVMEKSSAKIRPHTGIETNFLTKQGREGLIDLENMNIGVSLSFTPDLEKDIKFLYLNNKYSGTETTESLKGFFLESTGTIELLADTDLLFAGQAERFDGRSGTNFYYFLGLQSRLDDYFSGHVEAYKKKVDDTLGAIAGDVYNDGFEIGLTGETPVGLLFGGDYRHRYYSDGNSQARIHVFSSYNIYGEGSHLSFQYEYQYLENSESNNMALTSDIGGSVEGSVENDLYWKPETYNEHRLTVHFQHLIKGHYGAEGLKSYYSFDNSIGYEDYADFEDTQNLLYLGTFDIFLEMSPHYLLKGNLVFLNSDEYEKKSIHLSLLYRW